MTNRELAEECAQFAFHLRIIENQYAGTVREKVDKRAAELFDRAAAALRAPAGEPEGAEPTREMISTGEVVFERLVTCVSPDYLVAEIYKAMLAAAPSSEKKGGGG